MTTFGKVLQNLMENIFCKNQEVKGYDLSLKMFQVGLIFKSSTAIFVKSSSIYNVLSKDEPTTMSHHFWKTHLIIPYMKTQIWNQELTICNPKAHTAHFTRISFLEEKFSKNILGSKKKFNVISQKIKVVNLFQLHIKKFLQKCDY